MFAAHVKCLPYFGMVVRLVLLPPKAIRMGLWCRRPPQLFRKLSCIKSHIPIIHISQPHTFSPHSDRNCSHHSIFLEPKHEIKQNKMFCHYKKSTHHKKLSPGCVGIYLTCHLHFLIIFHFSYLYNLHISILVFCNFFKLNLLFLLLFLHGFSAAILNLDSTHTMNLDFSYFNLHLGFLAPSVK